MEVILHPDAMAMLGVVGRGEEVHDAEDDDEQPGDEGEGLVSAEGARAVRLALGEGVGYAGIS